MSTAGRVEKWEIGVGPGSPAGVPGARRGIDPRQSFPDRHAGRKEQGNGRRIYVFTKTGRRKRPQSFANLAGVKEKGRIRGELDIGTAIANEGERRPTTNERTLESRWEERT